MGTFVLTLGWSFGCCLLLTPAARALGTASMARARGVEFELAFAQLGRLVGDFHHVVERLFDLALVRFGLDGRGIGRKLSGRIDAQRLAEGPIATLKLPVRVRSTFHGMWVPAATLQSARYSV